MYMFDRTSYMPVFYRMIPGNIADKSALKETILAAGCSNCIIIGDKGFYSKKNVSFLIKSGFTFILPLQYNTKMIPEEFTNNLDDHKFDGCFVYKKRLIWHKTFEVFLHLSATLAEQQKMITTSTRNAGMLSNALITSRMQLILVHHTNEQTVN